MKFTLEKAREYIEIFYNTNKMAADLDIELDNAALMLVGEHGIGKTEILKGFAKEKGVHCEIVRLSQFDEIGQLKGYPIVKIEVSKDTGPEIVKRWITEKQIPTYINDGWVMSKREPVMGDAAPDFISRLKEGDILLLDDFSRNLSFFNNAIMEIIKEKAFGSWKLPKGVSVFLSSNPDDGNYDVRQLDGAQKDRITPIEIEWNKESWCRYADTLYNNDAKIIPDEYINFIFMNPEVVSGYSGDKKYEGACSIRRWTNFFKQVALLYPNTKKDLNKIIELGQIVLGDVIHSFGAFINNNFDKIITPEEIFSISKFETVIDKINESIKLSDNEYMIRNVITFRLSNYIDRIIENNITATPEMKDRLVEIGNSTIFEKDNKLFILKSLAKSEVKFKDVIIKCAGLFANK